MLMESMVAASTAATAQAAARSRMRTARCSRRSGSSSLLSFRPRIGRIGRENHRGGHNWAEERSAAHFIHAGDGVETARAQLTFERRFAPEFATRGFGSHG